VQVGKHCILELYNCSTELLNDAAFIQQALREAAKHADSTLLDEVKHQFHPQGVTALALLAESHISIHTWPEIGYAAADVFTCGQHTKPEKACEYLVEIFQASKHLLLQVPRRTTPSVTHPQPAIVLLNSI
jgi:S-adenosylmethionine decarboxylase